MTLDGYMIKERLSNPAFGEKVGKSGETIRRWRNGERDPGLDDQRLVFEMTGGEVTPNDWVGVGPQTSSETSESLKTEQVST